MWSSTYRNTARMHVTVRDAARFRSSAPEMGPWTVSSLCLGRTHRRHAIATSITALSSLSLSLSLVSLKGQAPKRVRAPAPVFVEAEIFTSSQSEAVWQQPEGGD